MGKKFKVIIPICILLSLFLVFTVKAAGYDWTMFGNSYQPTSQAQFAGVFSYFNTTVVSDTTIAIGQTEFAYPTQPLVSSLNDNDTNYLIMTNGNYIEIYNHLGEFYSETYSNSAPMGQLGQVDFDQDGISGELTGLFRYNNTMFQVKAYKLNPSTHLLAEIYQANYSYPAIFNFTGVRCSGYECYGVIYDTNGTGYDWTDFRFNLTGYVAHTLKTNATYPPLEPPSSVDYDSNSVNDYLIFSENRLMVYDANGNVIRTINFSRGANQDVYIRGAKFFKPAGSAYYKLAVVMDVPFQPSSSNQCPSPYSSCGRLDIYNIVDGTRIVENMVIGTQSTSDDPRIQGLAIADYDGDGYDDIWAMGSRLSANRRIQIEIFKGDGTQLYQLNKTGWTMGGIYPNSQITLAKMDTDSTYDLLFYDGTLQIFSPATNSIIYNNTLSGVSGQGSCIPADLTFASKLDVICTGGGTEILVANYTNQNAVINSVTYSPSTTVNQYSTLQAIISATDLESNTPFYYGIKCSDFSPWSNDSTSSTQSCTFNSLGTFNVTVRVRDFFHSDYVSFSQNINVITGGTTCNNNGTCDSTETYSSCPNDCPAPISPNATTQAVGGMAIPVKIVDTNNINEGLLPEVYFGLLAFFSNISLPFIVIVITIFIVLIIMTLGLIIKKIFMKIGN